MPVYRFTGTYKVDFWDEEIEATDREVAERELEVRAGNRLECEELDCEVVEGAESARLEIGSE